MNKERDRVVPGMYRCASKGGKAKPCQGAEEKPCQEGRRNNSFLKHPPKDTYLGLHALKLPALCWKEILVILRSQPRLWTLRSTEQGRKVLLEKMQSLECLLVVCGVLFSPFFL